VRNGTNASTRRDRKSSVTPLAPLAAFGVVWGWVEQKRLAVDLLKSAADAISGRLSDLRRYERRELIASWWETREENVCPSGMLE